MTAPIACLLAWPGLLLGAILLPTPLPVGLPLLAVSLAVLVTHDARVRGALRSTRAASRGLDVRVYRLETRVRARLRRLGASLRETRPSARHRARRRQNRTGRAARRGN